MNCFLDVDVVNRVNEVADKIGIFPYFEMHMCANGTGRLILENSEIAKLANFFDKVYSVLVVDLYFTLKEYGLDDRSIMNVSDINNETIIKSSITEGYIKRRVIKLLKNNSSDVIDYVIKHCTEVLEVCKLFNMYIIILHKSDMRFEEIDFTRDLESYKSV